MTRKKRVLLHMHRKRKLNKTKPIELIYTAINSKLMNLVRVQKAQRTETRPTQPP